MWSMLPWFQITKHRGCMGEYHCILHWTSTALLFRAVVSLSMVPWSKSYDSTRFMEWSSKKSVELLYGTSTSCKTATFQAITNLYCYLEVCQHDFKHIIKFWTPGRLLNTMLMYCMYSSSCGGPLYPKLLSVWTPQVLSHSQSSIYTIFCSKLP